MTTQPDQKPDPLPIIGWACAIVLPLAGLMIGLAVLSRGKSNTGIGIIALSLVASAVWAVILFG